MVRLLPRLRRRRAAQSLSDHPGTSAHRRRRPARRESVRPEPDGGVPCASRRRARGRPIRATCRDPSARCSRTAGGQARRLDGRGRVGRRRLPRRSSNDEAAEQDDRRPAGPPASIGDKLAADAHEWPCVKLSRGLDPARRCKVVGDRRDRQNDEQLEQRQAESPRDSPQSGHLPTLATTCATAFKL
jgi:hypothetical protein